MSLLDDLPPAVAKLVLEAAEAIARWGWRKATGDDDETADKEAIDRLKGAGVDALLGATTREADALVRGVELGQALEYQRAQAGGVMPAIERAARGEGAEGVDVPDLGLNIQYVEPGTLPDPEDPDEDKGGES